MLKRIARAATVLVLMSTLFFLFPPKSTTVHAENSANVTFQVNVQEVLSVSITTPTNWDKGNVGVFLRNKVTLDVTSNNINGFTALMNSTDSSANLYHSSKANTTLPTLTVKGQTRANFQANHWGYSTNDNNETGTYDPVVGSSGTPIVLISNDQSTGSNNEELATSRDIYFGAKSDMSQASGTYSGTVVFNIISGILPVDDKSKPNIPTNPATPDENNVATYDQTNNRTVYTTTTTDTTAGTTEQTTTITNGDTTSSYANPAGVTDSTSSNIYDGSMLNTVLAATASVAAASGLIFFILAKRKKDDDDEEETA